jgi:GNAT superfamily N-acetyltransferase
MLPNFDIEQHDWIICDRFRFEREDVAKFWTGGSGFTFYKLVYVGGGICEKVVVFDGNFRVGYVTWSQTELCGLYVMPNYRGKGMAKRLLSYVPPNLHIWIQDFSLMNSEPQGLSYDKLRDFYNTYYFRKENKNEKTPNAHCFNSRY